MKIFLDKKYFFNIFLSFMIFFIILLLPLMGKEKIPLKNALRKKSNKLIEFIVNKDTESIIAMLHPKQKILIDEMTGSISIHKIKKDFKSRGPIFLRLFDTKGFNQYRKQKYYKNKPNFKHKSSISEIFQNTKKKNLRISNIFTVHDSKDSVGVEILLTWDGKTDYLESGLFKFEFEYSHNDKKWYLVSLWIKYED